MSPGVFGELSSRLTSMRLIRIEPQPATSSGVGQLSPVVQSMKAVELKTIEPCCLTRVPAAIANFRQLWASPGVNGVTELLGIERTVRGSLRAAGVVARPPIFFPLTAGFKVH